MSLRGEPGRPLRARMRLIWLPTKHGSTPGTGIGDVDNLFISFRNISNINGAARIRQLHTCLRTRKHAIIIAHRPKNATLNGTVHRLLLRNISKSTISVTPHTRTLLFTTSQTRRITRAVHPTLRHNRIIVASHCLSSSLTCRTNNHRLAPRRVQSLDV